MLRREDIRRIVVSIVAEELGRARQRPVGLDIQEAWTDATRIDEDGVGADSLDKLDMIQRINEFFHLHEVGSEDYLVVRPTLGDWTEIVAETLTMRSERITFRTSGSTGSAKPVTAERAHLDGEIDAITALAQRPERIVSFVPPHHIYGCIWTALLAARWDAPVLDARARMASGLSRLTAGDLVIATPFLFEKLLRGRAAIAPGLTAVSSGAPMSGALWSAMDGAGFEAVYEVYGSTETAGVGWRTSGSAPFELFGHWRREGTEALRRADMEAPIAPPDHLQFETDRAFRPAGRRDDVVQVGGVNVSPAHVGRVIAGHPDVADCAVRLDTGAGADARLKAFVVLARPIEEAAALEALSAHLADQLPAPARPAQWTLGPEVPRTASGKLTDWNTSS